MATGGGGLEVWVRNSVAHEEASVWPGSKGGGENVSGEVVDGAGSDERSAVKSNVGCVMGGVGDTL